MSTGEHDAMFDQLSDFLDGTLAVAHASAVESHLEECGVCRSALEGLRAVVAEAKGLTSIAPPRDLWPGIAAAIQAPLGRAAGDTSVIPLHAPGIHARGEPTLPGLFSFSVPQLATAATILMLVSAGITAWVGPGLAVRDEITASREPLQGIVAVSAVASPPAELSAELSALEATLRSASTSLDAETVRILETNLDVIERAIADSRRALDRDPANGFLTEHLERAYHRKLDFLREVAQIVSWSS